MDVTLKLTGTTPLLMHNPRMVDPEFEISRKIKELSAKRKKTDEDLRKIGELEWYGGLYSENGIVVQPTSKVRKCLINAGKITKQGKAVERALTFHRLNVPLIYDGPKDIEELFKSGKYVSRLSVGIGQKRVMRVRPEFYPWGLVLTGLFVDDAGLNFDSFMQIADLAGTVEGIGDNRVNGYGRFTIEVTT